METDEIFQQTNLSTVLHRQAEQQTANTPGISFEQTNGVGNDPQMTSETGGENGPESDGGNSRDTKKRHFRGHWNIENTKEWVKMFLDPEQYMSATAIGVKVGADPSTIGHWLRKHNVEIYQGLRREARQAPAISVELAQLLARGPEPTMKFIDERIWGIIASADGLEQLTRFCNFLKLPLTVSRHEATSTIGVHRSTVDKWTEGTDQPYLVRAANTAICNSVIPGCKLLPARLEAGGNIQKEWIQVPTTIQNYEDIISVLRQIRPLDKTYERAQRFGIPKETMHTIRSDLFSYALGMALGDSGKEGGQQERFTSTNLDLHLSQEESSNEGFGEFTSLCLNSLGMRMERIKDKAPTGDTRRAKVPTDAYRWTSERSPLLAWMVCVGLCINADQTTSNDEVHMDWIFKMPFDFRKRFIQALADSDGTVKEYNVIITSAPNSEFVTRLLHSLDVQSARVVYEYGVPLRVTMNAKEAAKLPIFNEFVRGYRYKKLIEHDQP